MGSDIDFYVSSQYTLFGVPKCGSGIPILGVPIEDTVSFRPGTRFAPGIIRYWSQYFEFTPTEDLGIDVLSKACDLGDLTLLQGVVDVNVDRIRSVIKETIDKWGRIISIGGEHTMSLGTAKAVNESQVHMVFTFTLMRTWIRGRSGRWGSPYHMPHLSGT